MDWQVYFPLPFPFPIPTFSQLYSLSDEFGMLCYTDDDCTSVYGTGECDIVANRCKEVRKEMESGFLDCLISNVDSVTRSAIANELAKVGLFTIKNVGEGVTAELLREYLQEYECVSDYGPMSEYRERYVARSLNEPEEQFCAVVCHFFLLFFFLFFFFFFSFFFFSFLFWVLIFKKKISVMIFTASPPLAVTGPFNASIRERPVPPNLPPSALPSVTSLLTKL